MTESSNPNPKPVRGIAPGSLIERWPVFVDEPKRRPSEDEEAFARRRSHWLEAKPERRDEEDEADYQTRVAKWAAAEPRRVLEEPEAAYAERLAMWKRYADAITIDVRRTTREANQINVLVVDEAHALADEIDDNAPRKDRVRAMQTFAAGLLSAYSAVCRSQAVTIEGEEVGPILARVRGAVAVVDGEDLALEDIDDVERTIALCRELDLLDAVGQAVLRAQNPTEHMIRL